MSGGGVVLVSPDGQVWSLPAGRPEAEESWAETLRREVREEACATVVQARLLGFSRGVCIAGPEKGLVLVRSIWRADVELGPWDPYFEIRHRRLVAPADLAAELTPASHPFAPIVRRTLQEAGSPDHPVPVAVGHAGLLSARFTARGQTQLPQRAQFQEAELSDMASGETLRP